MATKNVNFLNNILEGGDVADTLIGDWRDNVIFGRGGDDTILGDGGNDTIAGDDGDDELFGQSGNDRLFGGRGEDILNGGADNDELFGGDDNDELRGGQGDDKLFGENGNDTIIDTEGVDQIDGGSGDDTITMRGGDAFRFDTVSGGSGKDTITALGSKVLVSAGSGDDVITSDLHGDKVLSGGAGSDRFVISSLETSAGRVIDILGGDGAVNRTSNIFGYEGIGSVTPGSDTSIDTLDLSQLTGLDPTAVDQIGVLSVNKLIVDLGTGLLTHVHGATGDGVSVPIEGQVAKLTGIENVIGTSGGDQILGNAVANDLSGRGGDDFLFGGAGGDTINGGSGRDIIVGDKFGQGEFKDTLTGGADSDRFVFVDVAKAASRDALGRTIVAPSVTDTITDFDTSGTDRDTIDFTKIFDEKTNFGGTNAQAIQQGFIYFVQHGTVGQAGFGTTVMVDLNGGTHADAANNFAVVDLLGVRATDLTSQHFLI